MDELNRINWLIELSKKFNKIILLSRRNLIACAESWAYLQYNEKQKRFKADSPYLWEKTPNYDEEFKNFIQVCPKEMLDKLSNPISNKPFIKEVS